MGLVVDLDDEELTRADVGGGKALNLGVLIRRGFPVPGGFCVTTGAYRDVVGSRLDPVIAELRSARDDRAADLAARARDLVAEAPVPEHLRQAITTCYAGLGPAVPVAVRSSATAEDLESASFAGQQDTYLNVIGADAVLDAVRRCWASLWTDRAVRYRQSHGIDPGSVTLAVVVQRMVDATAAGVLFTANPVTGHRGQTVLDASPGLGEAVVSGAVNPDRFVLDTATEQIVERRIGDKRVVIRPRPGGGTERTEVPESARLPCLDDAQVRALARLGAAVQDEYGVPQDIEWVIDQAARVWLTQARPITTLYPLLDPGAETARVFLCLTLAQGLTRPITPMGLAAFRLMSAAVVTALGRPPADPYDGAPGIRVGGLRLFVDATPMMRHRLGRRFLGAVFGVMEARAAATLARLGEDPRFSVRPGTSWRGLAEVARLVVWRVKVPPRVLAALVSPLHAYRSLDRVRRRLEAELALPADSTPQARLNRVGSLLGTRVFLLMPATAGYPAAGFLMLGLARRLLRGIVQPGELPTVLRGLPHNVTTEMDLALWQVAEEIRDDVTAATLVRGTPVSDLAARFRAGTLPPPAQRSLEEFLRRYGHRAVAEIDLGVPRWSDDPAHLLGVLKNYLALNDPALAPPAQFRQGQQAGEAAVRELVRRVRATRPGRAPLVAFALRRTRQLAGLRESPKFLLVLALARLHEHLARVGQALVTAGSVDHPDDVFFLDLREAGRGLAGEPFRAVVAERREAYAAELGRRHIPRLLLSDGTEPEALAVAAESGDRTLVGSPASAGSVTGHARVVLDPVGAELRPGEILVAPSTDPGWTPLFLTAGGLVMEMGGSNSHGAVVAREYGIPTAVGVPDATTRISTGQLITVDGAGGRVTLV